MKTYHHIIGMVLIVLVSHLSAQTTSVVSEKPPLPPRPWLKRTPDPSQWTVLYSNKDTQLDSSDKVNSPNQFIPEKKEVSVIKVNGLIFEKTVRGNGIFVQRWCMPGFFLSQASDKKQWISSPCGMPNSFNDTDYSQADFSGFDWISEQNYAGVKKVGSKQYLVFKDKVVTINPIELESEKNAAAQQLNDWKSHEDERKEKKSKKSKFKGRSNRS